MIIEIISRFFYMTVGHYWRVLIGRNYNSINPIFTISALGYAFVVQTTTR